MKKKYTHEKTREVTIEPKKPLQAIMDNSPALISAKGQKEQEIIGRKQKKAELRKHQDHLEKLVATSTKELQSANEYLKSELEKCISAEQKLKEYADEIGDLYDHSPCGYHSLNKEGKFIRMNQTELSWLGYSRDEIIGKKTVPDLLTPEFRNLFKKNFSTLKKCGWIKDLELEMIRKDGSTFPVIFNVTTIEDSAGEFLSSRATIFDNTDRKRIEVELMEVKDSLEERVKERMIELDLSYDQLQIELAERWHREAVLQKNAEKLLKTQRIGKIGFIEWNINTGEMNWSNETYELYGVDSKMKPTLDLLSGLVHPDDLKDVQKHIDLAVRNKRNYNFDHRMIRRDNGKTIWVHLQAELVHDMEADSEYLLGSVVDITGRKRVEEALRASEKGLTDAQRIAKLGNWDLDFATNELKWSDEIYRIFELEPHEFVVTYEVFLSLVYPEDRDLVDEAFKSSVANKIPYDIIHRLLMKDGRIKYVNEKGETYYDDKGNPLRSIGTVQDITVRELAEKELVNYRERLEDLVKERTSALRTKNEELNKSKEALVSLLEDVNRSKTKLSDANVRLKELDHLKSMFIASMSHELRTPLNSILGFTGIILEGMTGRINREQKEQLARVYGSAKHLLELITEIIDISKVEAGKIETFVESFPFEPIVQGAMENMRALAEKKGLKLEIKIPKKIILKTDRKRFLQCLLNYLSNAIKFTEKGKIILSANLEGKSLKVIVHDTGIGIRKEDLSRLFQSFVQLDSLRLKKPLGTGLGLYLTKKMVVEILGGSVAVESDYGKGSRFSLKIPIEYNKNTCIKNTDQ